MARRPQRGGEREQGAPRAPRQRLVEGEGDQRHGEQGLGAGRPRPERARRLGEQRERGDRGRAQRIEPVPGYAVGEHEQCEQEKDVRGRDQQRGVEERALEHGEVGLATEWPPVPERSHGPQQVQGALEAQRVEIVVVVRRGDPQRGSSARPEEGGESGGPDGGCGESAPPRVGGGCGEGCGNEGGSAANAAASLSQHGICGPLAGRKWSADP